MRRMHQDDVLTILTFIVVNFCNAMCGSMQAPFYPVEARKKGLEVWHFGIVFGAYELTVFLVSPFIGLYLNKIGLKKTLNLGILVVGVVLILYGCLGMLESGNLFLVLSIILRIMEACGNSAFLTGSFSAIAQQFPNNVASMFAVIELFYGLGEIAGPMFGGALYSIGGFTLPFTTMGCFLTISALFVSYLLPDLSTEDLNNDRAEKPSIFKALKRPSILIALFNVFSGAASIGFLQATLEPHLHSFKFHGSQLSTFQIGALFMVIGGMYGLSLPLWGCLCDCKILRNSPKIVEFLGALLISGGFLILGPFVYLPIKMTLVTIIIGMTMHGLGLGASVVGGFSDAHKSAIRCGFPDSIDTYGLVSGLWTSVFALGAFLGPTVGGVLCYIWTFPWAIIFIVGLEVVALNLLLGFMVTDCSRREKERPADLEPILVSDNEETTKTTEYGTGDVHAVKQRRRHESVPSGTPYIIPSLHRSYSQPGFMSLYGIPYIPSSTHQNEESIPVYLGSVNGPY